MWQNLDIRIPCENLATYLKMTHHQFKIKAYTLQEYSLFVNHVQNTGNIYILLIIFFGLPLYLAGLLGVLKQTMSS